jgi:hypothetical protein
MIIWLYGCAAVWPVQFYDWLTVWLYGCMTHTIPPLSTPNLHPTPHNQLSPSWFPYLSLATLDHETCHPRHTISFKISAEILEMFVRTTNPQVGTSFRTCLQISTTFLESEELMSIGAIVKFVKIAQWPRFPFQRWELRIKTSGWIVNELPQLGETASWAI